MRYSQPVNIENPGRPGNIRNTETFVNPRIYVVTDEPILSAPPADKANFSKMRHRGASGEIVLRHFSDADYDLQEEEAPTPLALSDTELLQVRPIRVQTAGHVTR